MNKYFPEINNLRIIFGLNTESFLQTINRKCHQFLEFARELINIKQYSEAQSVLTETVNIFNGISRVDPLLKTKILNLLGCCLR